MSVATDITPRPKRMREKPASRQPRWRPASRWSLFLWPPIIVSGLLLLMPQAVFVWMSLHGSLGQGLQSDTVSLDNYRTVLTDTLYLDSAIVTLRVSLCATLVGLVLAVPTAYCLACIQSRRMASTLIVALLVSSFVSIVIKVFGLSLLIGREGLVNHALTAVGLVREPLNLVNNEVGVVIGLVQYTLPLLVMMVFTAMQTIPFSLEEAAQVHGATWLSTMRRVILPILKPSILSAALIAFNLNVGAFTSAVLLGGGRVLTLPVVIQRQFMLDIDYGLGAAISTLLLIVVFGLNIVAGSMAGRAARKSNGATP